jgi:hypothetical protein
LNLTQGNIDIIIYLSIHLYYFVIVQYLFTNNIIKIITICYIDISN